MKVLVTGGTGFVGAWVARKLAQRGASVRILHRASSKLTALDGVPFESALGDVTDPDATRRACEGVQQVYHVAAVADYWRQADQAHMMHVNVDGTRHVLEAAQVAGVERVVVTSSAAALGFHQERPSTEADPFNLAPERFPYGYSKYLAEQVVLEYVAQGVPAVIVNPVVILGPGDLNLISGSFIVSTKQMGMFTPMTRGGISVIDVRDVADMHLAAAERGQIGERYILMHSNLPYSTWFSMIADAVGVRRPVLMTPNYILPLVAWAIDTARRLGIKTPIDANQARLGGQNVYFDGAKAHQALGQPRIAPAQMLADTYAWYREHGVL